jgi:hypothetical protein
VILLESVSIKSLVLLIQIKCCFAVAAAAADVSCLFTFQLFVYISTENAAAPADCQCRRRFCPLAMHLKLGSVLNFSSHFFPAVFLQEAKMQKIHAYNIMDASVNN